MDYGPEEENRKQDGEQEADEELTLIDTEAFYDLLMEQQEQM